MAWGGGGPSLPWPHSGFTPATPLVHKNISVWLHRNGVWFHQEGVAYQGVGWCGQLDEGGEYGGGVDTDKSWVVLGERGHSQDCRQGSLLAIQ